MQILEKTNEFHVETHKLFKDLEEVYDNIRWLQIFVFLCLLKTELCVIDYKSNLLLKKNFVINLSTLISL